MELNKMIDHTNLSMNATKEDIQKICEEAIKYKLGAVMVPPYYVALASELLKDTNIEIGTVIGFPLGYNTTAVKEYEAITAIEDGATEIDMVINVCALKNNDYEYIKQEIEDIRDAIGGKTLKIIIETSLLDEDEIIKMVEICNDTFVHYIKTSTGFGSRGASLEDIAIMKKHIGSVLEIKASGGIKTKNQMLDFINAGATRIGTSSSVSIMEDVKSEII